MTPGLSKNARTSDRRQPQLTLAIRMDVHVRNDRVNRA